MKTNDTIAFRKDDLINIPSEHNVFMSDGHSALHFDNRNLSEDYPSIKTWDDLFNTFKPKKFELYDFNGKSKDIVLV